MKNILKKTLLILLITLCAVLLAIGCPNNSLEQSNITSGLGTFSLKIAGSQQQGRTIMPASEISQFKWYRIIFSREGQDDITNDRTYIELGTPIELPVGTGYTLKVYAYTTDENRLNNKPAAYYERTDIEIKAGKDVSGEIILTAFGTTGVDYGGMGIFSWNIGFAQELYTDSVLNLSGVKIEIEPITGTSGDKQNFVLVAADVNHSEGQRLLNDSLTLSAGYYRVIIELSKEYSYPVKWRETLHVYENMTSSYSYTFTDDHFLRNFYTVTFDANGGSPSVPGTSYFYNDPYAPDDPEKTGYTFNGWFKEGEDIPWDFPHLTGDLVLAAKWKINQYTITFNNGFTPGVNESGASPVSVTADYGTKITSPSDPVRIKWEFMGWYKDAEYTETWDFEDDTIPAENISLYAKWEEICLTVDHVSITLQQIFGVDPLPVPQVIKISNTGNIPAEGITITISPTGLFNLANHSITEIAAKTDAEFTVQPTDLQLGTHEAIITIDYTNSAEPITIPVTFNVVSKWHGTVTSDIIFNSNSLIDIPNPTYGWYTSKVTGRWLRGIMIESGSNEPIEVPMTSNTYRFNNLNSGALPSGNLIGGVGRFWGERHPVNVNPSARFRFHVDIYIPNNGYEIWFQTVGVSGPAGRLDPDEDGWFFIQNGGGNPDRTLNIRIDSYSAWNFIEDNTFIEYAYPIFQQGSYDTVNGWRYSEVYYWKERVCPPSCNAECNLDEHVYDHWNVANEILNIVTFNSKEHNEPGEITIRAFDPTLSGVEFIPTPTAPYGPDMIMPVITESHYKPLQSVPLVIGTETVGHIDVKLLGHVQYPNSTTLSRVSIHVTYELDEDFVPFIDNITCNGQQLNGTGKTRTIEFHDLYHGPINLHHVFEF